jgi:hypothetical protein
MTLHLLPPPAQPAPDQPTRGDRLLAALIVVVHGAERLGALAIYAAVTLLAAIGAVSLLR